MNLALLGELKARSNLADQGRLQHLCRLPWKLVSPYVLARTGRLSRKEADTFFGRPMLVVLPEPVSVSIWRYGIFERDVAFYLMSILGPGDTFIDIGGHFGFFSMLGRELVGSTGTVVTFEPMPGTREILQENMNRFAPLAKHHLVPAAAGTAPGKLMFKDFGLAGSAFATSTHERNANLDCRGEVEVDVVTVDLLVQDLGLTTCKLIKIDAENAEMAAVRGALATIRQLRPNIIIEAGDDGESGNLTRKVVDVLTAEGYQPFEYREWAIRPHTVTETYGYKNILLVPSERVADVARNSASGSADETA